MSCDGFAEGPIVPINVGDLLPIWTADATSCDGPVDWSGWELTVKFEGPVTITGTAIGTADGVITYEWIDGDTIIPGDYLVVISGLSPTGKPRTFRPIGIVRIEAP